MKRIALLVFATGSSFAALAAVPDRVQFKGAVQQDALPAVSMDLHLPSKQTATIRLSDGTSLELATPGSHASADGALVRLVSPSGALMHHATIPDPGLASTSFAYRVCAGEVTYMNPAPAVLPACGP